MNLNTTAPGEQPGATATENPTEQPQPQQVQPPPTMTEDQQELLETIIEALEGEAPINADNEVLKELKEDYADEYNQLVSICQVTPFEGVFQLLMQRLSNIQPFPLREYLDIDATQQRQAYVWTEEGNKLIARLQELHAYLKTVAL